MGKFVTYLFPISEIIPVYIWDGDCFLNANIQNTDKDKYLIAVWEWKYNKSIIYNITGKEKSYIENIQAGSYIATKFLYIIYNVKYAHIIGGVIKVVVPNKVVNVYLYDDWYEAR